MKNEKFMRSVGEIGDDLLNEAAGFKPGEAPGKKNASARSIIFRRAGLIAAALAVVIAAAFVIPALFGNGRQHVTDNVEDASKDPGHVHIELPDNNGIVLNGGAYATDAGAQLPESLRAVEVLANGTADKIIATNSTLVVKTASECDAETFVKYVSVSPELPMAVTKVSATEFHLKPAQNSFAPDTLYRVTVGDPQNPAASFAFQTVNELAVKNILPGAGSTGAPVDTGIEITFTDAVKNADFSQYITVSPAVSGKFMLYPNGRTVAFIPENPLEYDSVYTVTVKEGLESLAGKTLNAGRTAVFRTEEKRTERSRIAARLEKKVNDYYSYQLALGDPSSENSAIEYTIITSMTNRLGFYEKTGTRLKAKATFYRALSWEHAAEAVLQIYSSAFTNGFSEEALLDEHFEKAYDTGIVGSDEKGNAVILYTPEKEGLYFAVFELECDGAKRTLSDIFQISSLRLGGLGIDGRAPVVVSYDNGARVPGAKISGVSFSASAYYGGAGSNEKTRFEKTCAEDGTTVLEYGADTALLFTCTDGERTLLAFKGVPGTDVHDYYINALYTDRYVYFANDTVNVWGTVSGVYGAEVPKELYLFTGFSSVGTPVTVSEDGFFSASVKIENAMQTYTYVRVEDAAGITVSSAGIRVTEEEKPVLKATMSFDSTHYFYGDTAEATVRVTFFDGTPAEGYTVGIKCYDFGSEGEKVTDKDGCARFRVRTGYIKAYNTRPITIRANAFIRGKGTDRINCSASFLYFHSDYVLDVEGRTLTLNELDRSECPGYVAGDPVTTNVNDKHSKDEKGTVYYELVKVTRREQKLKRYDKYLKRNIEYTEVTWNETTVRSGREGFTDGKLTFPEVDDDAENVYYYYRVTFDDVHNSYELTVSAKDNANSYGGYSDMSSTVARIVLDKEAYLKGDTINARFITADGSAGEPVMVFAGKSYICHATANEGAIVFTEELLPEVTVTALYFHALTGKWRSVTAAAEYDYASAVDNDITVTADKDVYKPGDTAVITVRSPRLAGGKALVSIVDEACFALGENGFDMLAYLKSSGYFAQYSYGNRYSGYLVEDYIDYDYYNTGSSHFKGREIAFTDLISYVPATLGISDGIEKASEEMEAPGASDGSNAIGTGKSYYVRENFADNPVFAELELNENGEATLTFKVPDNLTSWRVTVLGVKNAEKFSEIRIAQNASGSVCTLPFFVKIDACSTYIKGDDIALSVHCFGEKAQGTANYTAVLANENGEELARKSVSGDTKAFTGINFGKYGEGVYSVTVYADCGDNTDAVKSEFRVISSSLTVDAVKSVTADGLKQIRSLAYPVNVVIKGGGSDSIYSSVLNRLYYGCGERADGLAAKYAAALIMQRVYGGEFYPDNIKQNFSSYISVSGVKLFTYGEPDIELTALIADTALDLMLSRVNVQNIFETALAKESLRETELCAALYGLAACGSPVLDALYSVSSRAADFGDEAKLYLACGFAAAGDYSAAESIYSAIAEKYAKNRDNAMYFEAGDSETTVKFTSLALAIASRVKRSDAVKLARYAANIPDTHGESSELALAAFIRYYLPAEEQNMQKISYTLADGVKREAEIGFGRTLSLTLYKADFEALALENCENADITVRYTENAAEIAESGSGRIKVNKTVDGNEVTITVSGTSNRYWEYFELRDVIPSGARLLYTFKRLDGTRDINSEAYIYNRAGQRMDGSIYVFAPEELREMRQDNTQFCDEYSFSVTIRYLIRKAVAGEFAVEPAVVSSAYYGVYEYSKGNSRVTYE